MFVELVRTETRECTEEGPENYALPPIYHHEVYDSALAVEKHYVVDHSYFDRSAVRLGAIAGDVRGAMTRISPRNVSTARPLRIAVH